MTSFPKERILRKVHQVCDLRLECFGSNGHKYQLRACLTEEEVVEFESEHQIQLPEDYRRFLTEIGNGGIGPYYGIVSLEQSAKLLDLAPSNPVIITPSLCGNDQYWHEYFNCDVEQMLDGLLVLSHQGCTYYSMLIVNGNHYGQVVNITEECAGVGPFFTHDGSFIEWYERWLDELIAGYDMGGFGRGVLGKEVDLLRIAKDTNKSIRLRADALSTLCRMPSISDGTKNEIVLMVDNSNIELSDMACIIASRFQIYEAAEPISQLLTLKSRSWSMLSSSLSDLNRGLLFDKARELILMKDSDLVYRGISILQENNQLRHADLDPLISFYK